jgi:hypothetical protein
VDYLEKVKKLYEVTEEEENPYFCSYQPMLKAFGRIVIQVDDDDYQGDSRVLYLSDEKGYGYLQFGWGSCSGCDALKACNDHNEVAKLMKSLANSIKWANRDETLRFFREHDWDGDYSRKEEMQQHFIKQVIEYLEKA